ncbi:recombinase family protein [Aerococcaceae bacterium WS4759]|uniref:Recombinase family protein n=1 Tax=Fundicoccus ignavus TaxID=2664442 RepID=A0A6I2GS72_9LACT|nr:recombinase family protein [Fundicoccus ignavus]MRI86325.1 recombinase family protein [Fundicoccus ignavus]
MDLKDSMYYIPARRQPKRKRVAIYARVSSNTKDQLRSLANQVSALTQKVSLVEDWRLVDIYIDVASAKEKLKREEFNRLIVDCRNKKVTIVLTKSVSRFGRDTIEALETVRLLKELKVRIIFEKENINTLDSTGEVLITIMASLAQQESESISKNVTMGLRYRYQEGQVFVNHKKFLGYTVDEEGQLVINPKQSWIIKRIFKEYLEGKGTGIIARELMEDKVPTATGLLKWTTNDINRIIANEKYMGDALLQKTYTVDCLTKKRIPNDGSIPQYYIEDNHEAIVSKEIYNLAQKEKARRSNLYSGKKKKRRLYQGKFALSGFTQCGKCADIFRRTTWTYKGKKTYVWRCVTRVEKLCECESRTITEEDLHQIIVEAINQYMANKSEAEKNIELIIRDVLDKKYDEPFDDIEEELHQLQKKLLDNLSDETHDQIVDKLEAMRKVKQDILVKNASREEKRKRLADIKAFLKSAHTDIEEYEESLVTRLVKNIVIHDEKVEVELKTGDTIEVMQ